MTATELTDQNRHERALRWHREALLAVALYGLYSIVRDLQGSATVSYQRAVANAVKVIDLERSVGLFHEAAVQHLTLRQRWLIELANILYGSLHFIVTVAVIVMLYRVNAAAYRRARNALAIITVIALVGFTLFPMAPPRLLPPNYGFVDTLARYGTLWSFHNGPVSQLSNQYAAMPSLHFAWALWCALALLPILRSRLARLALFAYPMVTLATIIVTANHLILDAAASAAITAIAFAASNATNRQHRVAAESATRRAESAGERSRLVIRPEVAQAGQVRTACARTVVRSRKSSN
jgi:hypothetical protein